MTGGGRRHMAARAVFAAYTIVLLCGTHWPRLQARIGDLPRPDLYLHLASFGLFTVLLVCAQWFGPFLSGRNLAWSGVIALVFALVNEATQAIPMVQRHARLDDAAANVFGVALPLAGLTLLGALERDGVGRG